MRKLFLGMKTKMRCSNSFYTVVEIRDDGCIVCDKVADIACVIYNGKESFFSDMIVCRQQ